jgi:outer membrane protein OmpA-like peptidoglycan-associated protein
MKPVKTVQTLFNIFLLLFFTSISLVSATASSNNRERLVDKLNKENNGVQVVSVGDTLKIVLSVDRFFKFPSDARITSSNYATIDNIVALLSTYGNQRILITGHTDNVGSDESKLDRSLEQAKTIAGYLWADGIQFHNLYTAGRADTEALASNTTVKGGAYNRRVEITVGQEVSRHVRYYKYPS